MKFGLLVMTAGKQEGKVLEIKLPQFLIGRDPQCHLRPASPTISKRHCALIQRDGKVFVRDFSSTNGTVVNDEPVQGERELHDGDVLKIGPLLFTAKIEAGAAAPVKTVAKATIGRPTPAPPTKGAAPVKQPPGPDDTASKAPLKPAPAPAPAPAAPKPEKAPAAGGEDEEDIAAMLLSLQDDGPAGAGGNDQGEQPHVPDGTTEMEIKVPDLGPMPAPKGDTEKAKDKAKSASGNTSTAAASILEKMMRRPRT
jgi:predicted component of type VI protein secretion system